MLNLQFGEEAITGSFDSVFEVRAVHSDDFGWGEPGYSLLKKVIEHAEKTTNTPCYSGANLIFFVYAKYQPITIRVDDSVFNQSCLAGSFVTPDRANEMIWLWDWLEMDPTPRYGCLSEGSYTWYADEHENEVPYIAMQPVQGSINALDSLYGLSIVIREDAAFSPCDAVVSTKEHFVQDDTWIYPNPTHKQVYINPENVKEIRSVSVYDQTGTLLIDQISAPESLDFGAFKPGVYGVVLRTILGKTVLKKVVKL